MTPVADFVAATADGWLVLADGSAVIDASDRVVLGQSFRRGDGVVAIRTPVGEFQLLPRSLLITPDGEILDLPRDPRRARPRTDHRARNDCSARTDHRARRVGEHDAADHDAADHQSARRLTPMARHPFDFLSAALGVVAVGLGVLVSTASIDRVDTDLGWWFALAALVLGLGLIPWNRRRSTDDGSGAHPLGRFDTPTSPDVTAEPSVSTTDTGTDEGSSP